MNKYVMEENKSKDVELENANVSEENVNDENVEATQAPIEPEEKTEEKTEVEIKEGLVVNCDRVNVREEASTTSDAVAVLEKDSVVKVNLEESTDEFYRIFLAKTDGEIISGYCMKSFIKLS